MNTNKVEPIFKRMNQTKTEVFMRTLLKICYLPGILDKEQRTITFKLWSRPTVIHILIYLILYTSLNNINLFMMISIEIIEELWKTQSFVEFASLGTTFITLTSICMPLLIFKNMDKMNSNFLER